MPMLELRFRPFEVAYDEYYMDKAKKLGSGSFGKVYLIECRENSRTYAAKYQQLAGENSKRSVRVEAEMLSCLSNQKSVHSCVLRLKGYYESKIHTLLVTEYLQGGELFQKIIDPDYTLTERKCRHFVRQIVEGLNCIHSNNILHLDIKPQNVMFSRRGGEEVKLIDFGLARFMKKGTAYASFVGTIGFMAPEVLKCTECGTGTDFFSLGVLSYMLLSGGHEPFWHINDEKTVRRTLHKPVEFDHQMSEDAKGFITDLLEKKLENRLHGTKCLEHPWLREESPCSSEDGEPAINTNFCKSYLARTRWAKAIRAVRFAVRMAASLNALPAEESGESEESTRTINKPEFKSSEIPVLL